VRKRRWLRKLEGSSKGWACPKEIGLVMREFKRRRRRKKKRRRRRKWMKREEVVATDSL